MKKALVIGINEYCSQKLIGCVNDANDIEKLLLTNGDSSHNFDVKKIINNEATKENILQAYEDLFKSETEIALFYFSGHGYDDKTDGAIVTFDNKTICFKDLMNITNNSKSKYKIIILDCCFAGKIAQYNIIGDMTVLGNNTVILTACSPIETAEDDCIDKHGTFTKLLIGAREGGAADILGRITAGSVYSYIDQALGAWQQRPYFKANVSSFMPIRNVGLKMPLKELKKGLGLFEKEDTAFLLNPSFEITNNKTNKNSIKPYAIEENVQNMKTLQKMNQNGLVIPSNEQYMYYAAMKSDSVKLTTLGKNYWRLNKLNRI